MGINPLANSGFRTPTVLPGAQRRLIALISGEWKEGKTHMALGADPIIYYQSLDLGTEGVIEKFPPETLRLAEYQLTVQPGEANENAVAEAADQVWQKFCSDYYQALEDPQCRTVVWDTETEVWELLRLARFGVLNPKTGRDRGNVWGPVNAEMLGMIRSAFGTDKSLIMLERLRDEYSNDKKTGKRERKGFADAPYIAQIVMRAFRQNGNEFRVEIQDCRSGMGPELNGMVVENDWKTVKGMVYA